MSLKRGHFNEHVIGEFPEMLFIQPAGTHNNGVNTHRQTNKQHTATQTHTHPLKGSHRKNTQQSIQHVPVGKPIKIQTSVSVAQRRSVQQHL